VKEIGGEPASTKQRTIPVFVSPKAPEYALRLEQNLNEGKKEKGHAQQTIRENRGRDKKKAPLRRFVARKTRPTHIENKSRTSRGG